MKDKLNEKEKKYVVGAFELAYGYSAWELVKMSPIMAELFRKLDIDVGKEVKK